MKCVPRLFWCKASCFGLLVTLLSMAPVIGQEESKQRPPVTSVTALPQAIQDALQDRQYMDAVKLIEAETQRDNVGPIDYLLYLKGHALAKAGQRDEAVKTFKTLESEHPDSDWAARARFGRAAVAVTDRRYDLAGEIYGEEAKRLLSRERKDELASIYLEYADRYFHGVESDNPTETKQPDYPQALEFYQQAHQLGPSTQRSREIEYQIARCQEKMKRLREAIAGYRRFLQEHDAPSTSDDTKLVDLLSERIFAWESAN